MRRGRSSRPGRIDPSCSTSSTPKASGSSQSGRRGTPPSRSATRVGSAGAAPTPVMLSSTRGTVDRRSDTTAPSALPPVQGTSQQALLRGVHSDYLGCVTVRFTDLGRGCRAVRVGTGWLAPCRSGKSWRRSRGGRRTRSGDAGGNDPRLIFTWARRRGQGCAGPIERDAAGALGVRGRRRAAQAAQPRSPAIERRSPGWRAPACFPLIARVAGICTSPSHLQSVARYRSELGRRPTGLMLSLRKRRYVPFAAVRE